MIGTSLGQYHIIEQLGAGGMGEVYRARDSNLDRDVAIKVLPPEFIADEERLARFEREAKLLASLHHPGIATVHGFEEIDGVRFIAMEVVEGKTLAERIAEGGALDVDEALEIAQHVAEALEAAHDAGIVHRDLKPANVVVSPDLQAKVLDFGLAKGGSADGQADSRSGLAESPTMAVATQDGVILGTAPYMSPEQARGRPVDRRSDVWSFGCLLFEMLTGRRAFDGDTVSDTIAAILTAEPELESLPGKTPPQVHRLLRRALIKDPRQRLQHIGDARVEIHEARTAPASEEPVGAVGAAGRWHPGWTAALGLLVGLVLGFGVVQQFTASNTDDAPEPPTRVTLSVDLAPTNLSRGHDFAISADGRTVAYVTFDGDLFVRRLDEFEPRQIEGVSRVQVPFFSPDGSWIGYWSGGAIHRVPVGGGPAQRVVETTPPYGAVWTDDDRMVFGTVIGPLRVASAQGGSVQNLTEPVDALEVSQIDPHLLPDGRGVLFISADRLGVHSFETGETKVLFGGVRRPAYAPSGFVAFTRILDDTLWAAPFDLSTLEVIGDPFPVQPEPASDFQIARNGTLVFYAVAAGEDHHLVWVDRDGATEPLAFETGAYRNPRVSPDGQRIALVLHAEIWIFDAARGTRQLFAGSAIENRWPVWTHDGTRVAFTSITENEAPLSLFSGTVGAVLPPQMLLADRGLLIPISWSEQTQELLFYEMEGSAADLRTLLPDGTAQDLTDTVDDERSPVISPDGTRLAYVSNSSGRDEIYVVPYPAMQPRTIVSTIGGVSPVWSRDGSELYYRDNTGMVAVRIPPGETLEPAASERLFPNGSLLFSFIGRGNPNYDVAPDGRFLMVRDEGFVQGGRLHMVLGWAEGLANRASGR